MDNIINEKNMVTGVMDNVLTLYNLITRKSSSYWKDTKHELNTDTNVVSITWPYNGLCLDVYQTGYQLHNYKGFEINYTLEEKDLNLLVNDLITMAEL